MEDFKIVELFLSRDEAAISQTAGKYGSRLRRLADRIVCDRSTAEECENDTYMEAWRLIPPNEPRLYFFAFLGRITRHLALDELRKSASRKRNALVCELTAEMEECISGKEDVEGVVDARALGRLVDAFLEGCPEEQRNVFMRRYWFFDSISEICRRYGYSQSKVKTMLFRMREGLRDYLEKEGYRL